MPGIRYVSDGKQAREMRWLRDGQEQGKLPSVPRRHLHREVMALSELRSKVDAKISAGAGVRA